MSLDQILTACGAEGGASLSIGNIPGVHVLHAFIQSGLPQNYQCIRWRRVAVCHFVGRVESAEMPRDLR